MDAVKYIEEKERMCGTFRNCDGCPIWKSCDPTAEQAKETVAAVEKWSREHTCLTNGDKIVKSGQAHVIFEGDSIVTAQINRDWWDAEYKEERDD